MMQLNGKVALVTGCSAPGGIGHAIARRLAKDGAAVIVSDIEGSLETDDGLETKSSLLDRLADYIRKNHGDALATTLDVTSQDDVAGVMEEANARFGRLDILVNNAGSLAGSCSFMEATSHDWEQSFRVNLLGPMMLSQAAIPLMKRSGGGRIINIGSTGSLGAEAGFGAYTAMKHGLVGLSKTIAAEFGPDNILCNTVCPGYISTDMHMAANARLAKEQGVSVEDIKQKRYEHVAVRVAGSPDDVANAVAYLAGPQGGYVTGINLPVAGGVPFGI